jgi:hypothetical protein
VVVKMDEIGDRWMVSAEGSGGRKVRAMRKTEDSSGGVGAKKCGKGKRVWRAPEPSCKLRAESRERLASGRWAAEWRPG